MRLLDDLHHVTPPSHETLQRLLVPAVDSVVDTGQQGEGDLGGEESVQQVLDPLRRHAVVTGHRTLNPEPLDGLRHVRNQPLVSPPEIEESLDELPVGYVTELQICKNKIKCLIQKMCLITFCTDYLDETLHVLL